MRKQPWTAEACAATAPPRHWAPAAVFVAVEASHLGWEATHGGVLTHHLLARPDMPGLSNLWGLRVAPCLTGWAVWRWRVGRATPRRLWAGLQAGLVLGLSLSLAFRLGAEAVTSALLIGVLLSALVLPAHRAECLLGFVMGMCWTFGAVISLLAGTVIMALSALAHRVVYRGVTWLWRRSHHGAG